MRVEHTWRTIGGVKVSGTLTARKAIREHCYECMQSKKDPKECTSLYCALYPFRPGEKAQGRTMTEEEKEEARARLEKVRPKPSQDH